LIFARADVEKRFPLDANGDGKVTQDEFSAKRDLISELGAGAPEIKIDGTIVRLSALRALAHDLQQRVGHF
jgi:hypothetical protein